MVKLIKGVHHVSLKCASMESYAKTISFYRDLLGMETVRTWGEGSGSGIMLDMGDGALLEIFANAANDLPQGAIRHFALATDDVDACCAAIEQAGYDVFMKPTDIVINSAIPFPARIAFCTGPVGEEIELFCEK